MKVIIVAGGIPPSKKLLQNELKETSIIIGVDSGANCLYKYKITPLYLIGDFDSIDKKILTCWKNKNIRIKKYPKNKNETDAELALNKAIALGAQEISFLGCTGKRIDHLLGALGLLDKCLKSGIKATIKDDYQTVMLIDKSIKITGKSGNFFSLQSYGGNVKKLNISGAKYNLKDYELEFGDSLTLSNEFLEQPTTISFSQGKLLVILLL